VHGFGRGCQVGALPSAGRMGNAEANGRFEASSGYADAASGAALARALGAAGTMPSEIACRFQ
jgi:hypothetical protein